MEQEMVVTARIVKWTVSIKVWQENSFKHAFLITLVVREEDYTFLISFSFLL